MRRACRELCICLALPVWLIHAAPASAQPSGATAVHGQVALKLQGSTLTVVTQNGTGTNHSAIDWKSFSVPAATSTNIQQPSEASLSINRVTGGSPSEIFGRLWSNGRLVLVNPAGIAVGLNAVVDTAAFTASTLRMADADALAGRLAFGDGVPSGALAVNGAILARQGDVVLVSTDIRSGADTIIKAPNGSTVLAAGQRVALSGRGLEGIHLELQAPADRAINLGSLSGDAVAIFASQLSNTGTVSANTVRIQGGRLILVHESPAELASSKPGTAGAASQQGLIRWAIAEQLRNGAAFSSQVAPHSPGGRARDLSDQGLVSEVSCQR